MSNSKIRRYFFIVTTAMWVVSTGWAVLRATGAQTPNSPATPSPSGAHYAPVVKQYCVTCHNDRLKTAELSLGGSSPARSL